MDYNASTPMAPTVRDAIIDSWEHFANPSGSHFPAQHAEKLLDQARELIAQQLKRNPQELIFTSGSTEGLTIAIWSILISTYRSEVLISEIEHSAVIETAKIACSTLGKKLIFIPTIKDTNSPTYGTVDLDFIYQKANQDTALVACMAVNNETGIIQPFSRIDELLSELDIPYLCDSTQVYGKYTNFKLNGPNSMFLLSGHKVYGPKGSGVLIMNRDLQKKIKSISPGGGQERSIRGGTSNVASAIGLAKALEYVSNDLEEEISRQEILAENFIRGLKNKFGNSIIQNCFNRDNVIPNTVNISFNDAASDAILASLQKVIASRASACTAGVEEPSHVLLAMGIQGSKALESIRFSIGRLTTQEEIDASIQDVSVAVDRVRALS